MTTGMTFSQALELIKQGKCVYRAGWNGKGMWVRLCQPNRCGGQGSEMLLDYLEMYTADKKLVPWLASQTDILADDWSCK